MSVGVCVNVFHWMFYRNTEDLDVFQDTNSLRRCNFGKNFNVT